MRPSIYFECSMSAFNFHSFQEQAQASGFTLPADIQACLVQADGEWEYCFADLPWTNPRVIAVPALALIRISDASQIPRFRYRYRSPLPVYLKVQLWVR